MSKRWGSEFNCNGLFQQLTSSSPSVIEQPKNPPGNCRVQWVAGLKGHVSSQMAWPSRGDAGSWVYGHAQTVMDAVAKADYVKVHCENLVWRV